MSCLHLSAFLKFLKQILCIRKSKPIFSQKYDTSDVQISRADVANTHLSFASFSKNYGIKRFLYVEAEVLSGSTL